LETTSISINFESFVALDKIKNDVVATNRQCDPPPSTQSTDNPQQPPVEMSTRSIRRFSVAAARVVRAFSSWQRPPKQQQRPIFRDHGARPMLHFLSAQQKTAELANRAAHDNYFQAARNMRLLRELEKQQTRNMRLLREQTDTDCKLPQH